MINTPLRVLHIIWWNQIGGIAFNLVDLIEHIDLEKYKISVCILAKGNLNLGNLITRPIEIVQFDFLCGLDVVSFWRFFRYLRTHDFDIVHNHSRTFFVSLAIMLARRRFGTVFQEHGALIAQPTAKRMRTFYRCFGSTYDKFIGVSAPLGSQMAETGLPVGNIAVVENPVDTDKFRPNGLREEARLLLGLPMKCLTVGTACRLVQEKDLDLFLSVARCIHSQRDDIHFIIAGTGPLGANLQRTVQDLGLSGAVHFLGARTDMQVVWRAIDIFLYTSLVESFGRTLLEAQACSTPVVASLPLAGGAIDIIQSSPGILSIPNRQPGELARTVVGLLESKDDRERIGTMGRDWVVARFDVKEWVKKIQRLYDDISRLHKLECT